jgi:serine/threonine protein phosphatase PrpC
MGSIEADAVEESPSLLGVCDGVSEVQRLGIDPGEFPKELLQSCRETLEHRQQEEDSANSPRWWPDAHDGTWLVHMLEEAYDHTESQGSSTVLLAAIEDSNRLVVCNLGDCTLLLLRPSPLQPDRLEIVYHTEALRYDHNKPYQIARLEGVPESSAHAVIQRANCDAIPARHGDIIVMGSDGLFDNLHEQEAVNIIEQSISARLRKPGQSAPVGWGAATYAAPVPTVPQLEAAADALVDAAIANVCQGTIDANGHIQWPPEARQTPVGMGGKPDDTTALVACLVQVDDLAAFEEIFYQTHSNGQGRFGWLMPTCCSATGHQTARSNNQPDAGCNIA